MIYFIKSFNFIPHLLLLYLNHFNLLNAQNFIEDYELFSSFKCELNGKKVDDISAVNVSFKSKLSINCTYLFKYNRECYNQNKTTSRCDNISLHVKYPKELISERVNTSNYTNFGNNILLKSILLTFESIGKKNNGFYLIEIQVKNSNTSNFRSYFGANFTIHINELGDSNDICKFPDQCFSNICTNSKCICSKGAPISHDGSCLKDKKLLESCFVTEQCQFGGLEEIICKDLNGNKSCRCLPQYFLLESPIPKCLSPKQNNQSCEVSEECQSHDGKSFCSAQHRCQCIRDYNIDNSDICMRTYGTDKCQFPYAVIISTIAGLLILIIAAIFIYKYYFSKQLKSRKVNKSKRKSIRREKSEQNKEIADRKLNKLISNEIELRAKNLSVNDSNVENENIYDDISEIRYVSNKKTNNYI